MNFPKPMRANNLRQDCVKNTEYKTGGITFALGTDKLIKCWFEKLRIVTLKNMLKIGKIRFKGPEQYKNGNNLQNSVTIKTRQRNFFYCRRKYISQKK